MMSIRPYQQTTLVTGLFTVFIALGGATAEGNPPAAQNTAFQQYWGPMEPLRVPHAGPQARAGTYLLSWADVPTQSVAPQFWNWTNGPVVTFLGAHRYFVHFRADGAIDVWDEDNLPEDESKVNAVANFATVWFQNSTQTKRIAVRYVPLDGRKDLEEEASQTGFWGPMEPLREAHAGPEQAPGNYLLQWSEVPNDAVPSSKWPWKTERAIKLEGGKRYFIHFSSNGQVHFHDESGLPANEARVKPVPNRAIVWFQNSHSKMRIAVRLVSLDRVANAAGEGEHGGYWGPMEPKGPAHAGPERAPGTYRIVWAVVPVERMPAAQWPWQNGPIVKLSAGKRYFINFSSGGRIDVYEESALPAAEAAVRPVPERALVWFQNSTIDQRIAVRLVGIDVAGQPQDVRVFQGEGVPKIGEDPASVITIRIENGKVTGDYDSGQLPAKKLPDRKPHDPGIDVVRANIAMENLVRAFRGVAQFEGHYVSEKSSVSGTVTTQLLIGNKPQPDSGGKGTFEGVIEQGSLTLTVTMPEGKQLPRSGGKGVARTFKLTEVHKNSVPPPDAGQAPKPVTLPKSKSKGGEL